MLRADPNADRRRTRHPRGMPEVKAVDKDKRFAELSNKSILGHI